MPLILGIDPGSRVTGYGLVRVEGNRSAYVASGEVRVEGETLAQKLHHIFTALSAVIEIHAPDEAAVEQVFMHRNPDSALKLGQARGAAICALAAHGLPVAEYTPQEIKRAVVGGGRAVKEQVQHMVKALLNLSEISSADAADALAVALCHGHTGQTLARMGAVTVRGRRGGRWR